MTSARRARPCVPCVILSVGFVVAMIYGVVVAFGRMFL
jgi:hypothetical protein